MSDLITKQRILGKQYTLLGDGRDDIILNGAGNVKVRFGNAFIDLLKDGRISASTSDTATTVITKVDTKSSIPESDGWYFTLDTGMLYYKINSELYLVLSEKEGSDDIGNYVSFTELQGLSMEQILIAQTNIKNIIDDTTDLLTLPNGLAFFDITRSRHYINYDGILTEIYLSLAHGGIVRNSVTITNDKSAAGGPELFNIVGGNLNINNNGNNLNLSLDELNSIIKSSTENLILSSSFGNAMYINKTVGIGTEHKDEYALTVGGDIYTENKGIFNSGIQSSDYREGYNGYSLYKTYIDGWVLEVDKLIVRGTKSDNLRLVGYNNNTYISQSGIVESIEAVYPTDADGNTIEDSEPSSYIINLTKVYDIAIGDVLEFDVKALYHYVEEEVTDEDGYTETQDVLYNEVVTLRRGLFTVTSVEYNVDREYICIIEGTLSDNIIASEVTIPEVGDMMVKISNDTNLYINSINHEPYIKATSTEKGDLTILGNLNNLVFNGTTYTNKDVGIYTNRLLGGTGTLLNLTVEDSLRVNGNSSFFAPVYMHSTLTVNDSTVLDSILYVGEEATFQKNVVVKGDLTATVGSTSLGNTTITGNLHIYGNITQDGDAYITHAEILNVENHLIIVNKGPNPSPTLSTNYSGIQVDRQLQPASDNKDYLFIFDESDDRFKVGKLNSLQYVATRDSEGSLINNSVLIWDSGDKYIKGSNAKFINGALAIENHGNTLSIGDINTSYTHFINSVNKPFHFNCDIRVAGNIYGGPNYDKKVILEGQPVKEANKLTERVSSNGTSFDLNTELSGGGAFYNYNSTRFWLNSPSGASYGSVFQFKSSNTYDNLNLQLLADINHNVTTSTKDLWFRTSNNLGFQNDWKKIYHSGNANSSTIDWNVRNLQASSWLYTGYGWFNSVYGGGIHMNDYDHVKVYNDKVLYNDGSRTFGVGGHRVGLRLYAVNHIGINLENDKYTWGIYSNDNGALYIGRRDGYGVTNNNDHYITTIKHEGLTVHGTETTSTTISAFIGSTINTPVAKYTVYFYNEYWQWNYYRGDSSNLEDIRLVLNGARKLNLDKNGNFSVAGAITPNSASDRRLKSNITPIKSKASDYLNSLKPVEFDWNETALLLNPQSESHGIGFIADEYEQIFPQYTRIIYDEYKSIDTTPLFAILTKGWQEHDSEIDKLKEEINNLKYEIKLLKFKLHGA